MCQETGLEWFLLPPSPILTPHLNRSQIQCHFLKTRFLFAQIWSGTYFSPCCWKLHFFTELSNIDYLFSVYLSSQTRSSKRPVFLFYPLTHHCIPRAPLSAENATNICEMNEYIFENRMFLCMLWHPIVIDILVKNEIILRKEIKVIIPHKILASFIIFHWIRFQRL